MNIEADVILGELLAIATARLEDALDLEGGEVTLKPPSEMSEEARAALASVSIQPGKLGTTVKAAMANKLQALDLLGKHLGLFNDFNGAIATLRKYGLELKQTESGWEVTDVNANPT